jgi:hypothetical protein
MIAPAKTNTLDDLAEQAKRARDARLVQSAADSIELLLSGLRAEIDRDDVGAAIGRVVRAVAELRKAGEV